MQSTITDEVFFGGLVTLVAVLGLALAQRRFAPWEGRLLWAGLIAHGVSGIAMVLMTVYFFKGGDMMWYHEQGILQARLLSRDFTGHAPQLLQYTMGVALDSPEMFPMAGFSTGSMMGISGWLMYLVGDSVYAGCLAVGYACFFSQLFTYAAFRAVLPRELHRRVLAASVLLPSVVFWTSGLLKEPIAMVGVGPLVWGMAHMIHGRRWLRALTAIGLGAIPIALVKPYILFALALAAGAWFYWRWSMTTRGSVALLKRPIYLILAAGFAVGGMMLLGDLFPRFAFSNVGEEAARLQGIVPGIEGGSNYELGDVTKQSLGEQLVFAPVGLLFALFRPLPFEARNAAVLMNSLEMMVFVYLWLKLFRVRPWRQTARILFGSPPLVFCAVFTIVFGAAVGISSLNVGTLSRYRVPMMPFYGALMLALALPVRRTVPAPGVSLAGLSGARNPLRPGPMPRLGDEPTTARLSARS